MRGKKDNFDTAVRFRFSALLLVTRTLRLSSFPLSFPERSPVELSFAACSRLSRSHLPAVPYRPLEYSLSFAAVFALLPPFSFSFHVNANSDFLSCSGGSGVVQLMLSFASAHAQMDAFQPFLQRCFSTTHSMLRSVVEMLMELGWLPGTMCRKQGESKSFMVFV